MLPKRQDLPTCWTAAAIRTLHASWWTVTLAKIFGRRFTGEEMEHTIVGHEWRGKFYLTDYQ